MNNYTQSGLVNTKDMLKKAYERHYAVPAYNFNNLEQVQAIVEACIKTNSPVILQASKFTFAYSSIQFVTNLVRGAVSHARNLGSNIPIALHLDHGDSFDLCKMVIDHGFSSVMIDGSHLSFEENIALTKQVVDYAGKYEVTVEGELGKLAGIEDNINSEESTYTKPDEVVNFVTSTGVDSLAISIGTSHGAHKFKPEQCSISSEGLLIPPPLRFDILQKVSEKLPGFPIVLHGSSTVPKEFVTICNTYGGSLANSIGIPEDQLSKASKMAVCKINIDSDGKLAMTALVRKFLHENPSVIDPREFLKAGRKELIDMYIHKNSCVLFSAGNA